MRCFHPVEAWQLDSGRLVFGGGRKAAGRHLELRCGQCIGCRLNRSREWAIRCVHEASMHEGNSFVTLTYDDKHLPPGGGLVYRDFQDFMRRVRKRFGCMDLTLWGRVPRFFVCGEYGELTKRPHFHALLFGLFFPDRQFLRTAPGGARLYRSAMLEELWPAGFSSVGDVTFESAAYVARYVLKKVTGERADAHYRRVDGGSGEVLDVEPEFCRMSLKPGIGATWFQRFAGDVYPQDSVVLNGSHLRPPRYYDKLLARSDAFVASESECERELRRLALSDSDSSSDRLAVQELVATARLSFNKRSLE